MYQNKDGDLPEPDAVAPEERAYEDNWYRSLKALADQRLDEDDAPETAEDPAGDPVDVAPDGPVAQADGPEQPEAAPADGQPPAADRERLVSQEFETRAGQLLERLRSIQHLGER
ncbi:MAG TPA: hypothetical protein VFT27_05110 [Actinomycetota bacterium]|nr:hypothetical protein [Actinomycetota bacterium]